VPQIGGDISTHRSVKRCRCPLLSTVAHQRGLGSKSHLYRYVTNEYFKNEALYRDKSHIDTAMPPNTALQADRFAREIIAILKVLVQRARGG